MHSVHGSPRLDPLERYSPRLLHEKCTIGSGFVLQRAWMHLKRAKVKCESPRGAFARPVAPRTIFLHRSDLLRTCVQTMGDPVSAGVSGSGHPSKPCSPSRSCSIESDAAATVGDDSPAGRFFPRSLNSPRRLRLNRFAGRAIHRQVGRELDASELAPGFRREP